MDGVVKSLFGEYGKDKMSLINKIIGKLNLSPTKEKVVRNVVWAVTGKVVTLLGSLLVGILVARYLGPEQYGLMN